jgi:hypothetical protein
MYLSIKVICLLCFSHWDLPNIDVFGTLESPRCIGVHWGALVVFRLSMQELLNIEQFFQRKFNKIKIKYIRKLGQVLYILGSPWQVGFHGRNLIKFRLKVVKIFHFCKWKLIEFFSPPHNCSYHQGCVHTWKNTPIHSWANGKHLYASIWVSGQSFKNLWWIDKSGSFKITKKKKLWVHSLTN